MSILYLRELPSEVQAAVCAALGEDRAWETLATFLQEKNVSLPTIKELERTPCPGKQLLDILMNRKFKDGPIKMSTFLELSLKLKLYKVTHCLEPLGSQLSAKKPPAENNFDEKSAVQNITVTYLHQLPAEIISRLCVELNAHWDLLLTTFDKFGFDVLLLLNFSKMTSRPSREVIQLLADRNLKISLLYEALQRMNLPAAFNILQSYVPEDLTKNIQPSYPHRQKPRNSVSSVRLSVNEKDSIYGNEKPSLVKQVYVPRGSISHVSYKKLSDMTHGWSEENRLGFNGRGNFYRGQEYAIKRLLLEDVMEPLKVFEELHQLELSAEKGHKNVLKMLMLIEGNEGSVVNNPCIIYPFIERKSLYDNLLNKGFSNDPTSSWKQKHIIALGVTDALIHLQRCFGQKPVVAKSSDILLDDKMEPLVADVCLPSMLDRNNSEYLAMYLPTNRKQEMESFCLGTILLELATGKPADLFDKHPDELRNDGKDITMGAPASRKLSLHWKASILMSKTNSLEKMKVIIEKFQEYL